MSSAQINLKRACASWALAFAALQLASPLLVRVFAGFQAKYYLGLWNVNLPKGKIASFVPSAADVVEEARRVQELSGELVATKYFRIFRVDLNKPCPFWARSDLCAVKQSTCSVCECDEHEVPRLWKEQPVVHYVDRQTDKIVWKQRGNLPFLSGAAGQLEQAFVDALASEHAVYVDLERNPPVYTAYRGARIWSLARGNSFAPALPTKDQTYYLAALSGLQTTVGTTASEYHNYGPYPGLSEAVYRFVHSNPLTRAAFGALLPLRDGRFPYSYNFAMFDKQINRHEYIANLYAVFSLTMRVVNELRPVIDICPCATDNLAEDKRSRELLERLLDYIEHDSQSGSMKLNLFSVPQSQLMERAVKILNLIDCVECEMCRLHGKIKVTALQVVLKTLGNDTWAKVKTIEKNELNALINTLKYFADAIVAVQNMQRRATALRSLFFAALATVYALGYVCRGARARAARRPMQPLHVKKTQ